MKKALIKPVLRRKSTEQKNENKTQQKGKV